MKLSTRIKHVCAALLAGAVLTGCCVAPVAPYPGPRYGAVYEPAVVVAPAPHYWGWGWRH